MKLIKTETGKKNIKKILIRICTVIVIGIGTLAVLLSRSCEWMLKTWTGLTMEELVYHLNTSLEGTNTDMIWDFIGSCVVITVITCVLLIAACMFLRKRKKAYGSLLSAVTILSVVLIVVSVSNVWTTLDVSAYANNRSEYSTFIDDNYVDPQDVTLTFPQQKRNLIYIFLESMENTYSDIQQGGAFEENVIPELTQLSLENENFSGDQNTLNGGYAMPGTTWTIGAMFGQSTGLPLNIPIEQNSMDTQESFLPDIVSLGDILESAGYRQILMIGSEAEFGGRKLYYQQHGNYEIIDYNYAKDTGMIPEDYRAWWGFEDKRLFEFAKNQLNELAQEDEPFNLTLLTVDTHFEDGYHCEICPDTFGDDVYANVIACASHQVYEFVEWIRQQPFYENTTIVISGDHPTMDSDFCENVPEEYTRKVYTTYINSSVEAERNSERVYTTFDNFPTTLAAMGVSIEGERLGLGTNLFSSMETLSEIYGYEREAEEISKKSKLIDQITEGIEETKEIEIQEETEEELPYAETEVLSYDTRTDSFLVSVSNLQTVSSVQSVRCAVWPEGEQDNKTVWYEGVQQEDGSYVIMVSRADFEEWKGTYMIHSYAVTGDGSYVLLSGTSVSGSF